LAPSRSRLNVAMRNPRHARWEPKIGPAAIRRTACPQAVIREQDAGKTGKRSPTQRPHTARAGTGPSKPTRDLSLSGGQGRATRA
jgi:hypothetical protein